MASKATAQETEVTTEEEVEEEVTEEEVEAPVIRYVTTTIDLIGQTDATDEQISGDALSATIAEQLVLPSAFDVWGRRVTVLGGEVTGSSESSERPQIKGGFGRAGDPVEEGEGEEEVTPS
jgi:hypothetical protein